MNAPVETKCDSFACAHPWAFSTINFTAVFKNDAIGPASRGKIDVRLQLPVNSTYDFLLSNITISSEDFGATNHTLTTGVNVVWNNVTANMGSDVHILASIPSDKNRALRVVSVYIERFLKPNASEYLNETLTFSMGANIDGQDASVDYINRNSSKVFVLLKPTASEPIPQTPAANSSLAFSIGYKEPVMVGLGVLLFILFLIIAVAVCGIVWMLNKPGAEATETALLKSSTQGDRPVAESPRLPVQV